MWRAGSVITGEGSSHDGSADGALSPSQHFPSAVADSDDAYARKFGHYGQDSAVKCVSCLVVIRRLWALQRGHVCCLTVNGRLWAWQRHVVASFGHSGTATCGCLHACPVRHEAMSSEPECTLLRYVRRVQHSRSHWAGPKPVLSLA